MLRLGASKPSSQNRNRPMTDETISPLHLRMTFLRPPKRASRRRVEDMTVRGFTACTQRGYIAVTTMNGAVSALRFFSP